ncbi:Extracellular serine-rich protein [Ceratocystis fimbriata CBS 114723]|uniref:Extracellular serine-rich protein n=1 Tax=Ceratocystis fimbriata CBS 114723 TaxID=1035309 RepID=A0A2C5X1G7_9PEZI|nr:Extracellular serine-rich protein [Ceratocystis fimbriata CBS 114723]
MRLTTALLAFAASALAMPSGTTGNEPSKVAARASTTHIIFVSNFGIGADNFQAKAGDILEFRFSQGTHSVTQASFEEPCKYLEGGFASGLLVTYPNESQNEMAFRVTVKDDDPIWFYKGGVRNCHTHGHVGVVNPPDNGQSYNNFKTAALQRETTEEIGRRTGGTLVKIDD